MWLFIILAISFAVAKNRYDQAVKDNEQTRVINEMLIKEGKLPLPYKKEEKSHITVAWIWGISTVLEIIFYIWILNSSY